MQSKGLRGGKKIETSKASMIAAWCLTAMLCQNRHREIILKTKVMQEMAAAPYAQTMTQSQTLLETLDVVARQDCSTPRQCIA